jgi:hypothetical protein
VQSEMVVEFLTSTQLSYAYEIGKKSHWLNVHYDSLKLERNVMTKFYEDDEIEQQITLYDVNNLEWFAKETSGYKDKKSAYRTRRVYDCGIVSVEALEFQEAKDNES